MTEQEEIAELRRKVERLEAERCNQALVVQMPFGWIGEIVRMRMELRREVWGALLGRARARS